MYQTKNDGIWKGIYNCITTHWFTLRKIFVSYDGKHNEANGENTIRMDRIIIIAGTVAQKADQKKAVLEPEEQMRNALFLLLLSRGCHVFLPGMNLQIPER